MGIETDRHIAERTRTAQEQMDGQDWLDRAKSKLGLFTANFLDKRDAWMDDKNEVFKDGLAHGAFRGAEYGFVAGLAAIALLASASVLAPGLGALVVLGCMAAGSIGFAIYDSQTQLDENLQNGKKKLSDTVAEKSGAVPHKEIYPIQDAHKLMAEAGRTDPVLQAEVDSALAETDTSFKERENLRRAAPPPPPRFKPQFTR